MSNKNKIISALIAGKKNIFNCRITSNRRVFQLGGIGPKALKVKPNRFKDYPHLEIIGFLDFNEWDNFTDKELALVEAFYNQLPK